MNLTRLRPSIQALSRLEIRFDLKPTLPVLLQVFDTSGAHVRDLSPAVPGGGRDGSAENDVDSLMGGLQVVVQIRYADHEGFVVTRCSGRMRCPRMPLLGSKRTLLLTACILTLTVSEARPQAESSPDMLAISAFTRDQMRELIEFDKFAEDPDTFYPGVPNKPYARILNRAMNASLTIIMSVAEDKKSRTAVLDYLRIFLERARTMELATAEKERVCWCYDQACKVLGIDIPDGLFENWLL